MNTAPLNQNQDIRISSQAARGPFLLLNDGQDASSSTCISYLLRIEILDSSRQDETISPAKSASVPGSHNRVAVDDESAKLTILVTPDARIVIAYTGMRKLGDSRLTSGFWRRSGKCKF